MPHLSPEAVLILTSLLLAQTRLRSRVSLYQLARSTSLSMATVYRKAAELSRLGLLLKLGRGSYVITPRGSFYLATIALEDGKPEQVLRAAVARLKNDWGLEEFTDEEVEAYVRLVSIGLQKLGRPPLGFCADDFGRTVQVLLPPKFSGYDVVDMIAQHLGVPTEMVKRAERVIAKAILEFFPSIRLPDGCRSVVIPHGEYGLKLTPLAAYCRASGYTLGLKCTYGRVALMRIFQKDENKGNIT
ncbi:transcriptional regulator [Thermoproteus tenax]|uniref:Transcriptional regulator containing HTH domain n=1 Tax=Thermoproteus tenax (strain ATCC 35583 / DSM 2078 / JCM 9277 / NBRC 100435 / Kra 1) TaxID=768679 RepID=G4RQ85_THETK|nr:transcriptional regulator [Thermoproteus tenax]CCC80722.1 Transcriptional regulator containing HTH domain [Thermoproteus tenax Kra 1]